MKIFTPKNLLATAVLTIGLGTSGVALTSGGASDYAETEYPIVLVHGFMGMDTAAGIIDYWYGIPEALEKDGADVHVVLVSAANTPEARGEPDRRHLG